MLDTQLRGQLMGPNLNIRASVGWASRGNGWDGLRQTRSHRGRGQRHHRAGREVLPQVPRRPLRWPES